MNQSKLFTLKKNQSSDIQWRNRDINNYFYEGKKNFFRYGQWKIYLKAQIFRSDFSKQ